MLIVVEFFVVVVEGVLRVALVIKVAEAAAIPGEKQ